MCFLFCNDDCGKIASRDVVLVGSEAQAVAAPSTRIRVPIYKKVSRRQCPLIDYTWDSQWMNVVARCHSHPSEAAYVSDHSGRTALHLASFNQGCPDYVAVALIQANPHALIKQDSYGQTPLHYAAQFRGGTNDLVMLYCEKLVEFASRMDVLNACPIITASPLYLACLRNAPISLLNTLLSTRQSIGTCWIAPITGGEPYWEHDVDIHEQGTKSPLSVLVESTINVDIEIDVDTRQEMRNAVLSMNEDVELECEDSPTNGRDAVMPFWLKSLLLLRSKLQTYSCNNANFSLLHLVAALKVPVPVLVDCCAVVFPEEVLQRDFEGFAPLHYALLNPSFHSSVVIQILLQKQPEAASLAFPNGKSPLVVALEKQRVWCSSGIEQLVMAAPDALEQSDVESGLYPFQLAASLNSNETVIYKLVRLRPDLLASS